MNRKQNTEPSKWKRYVLWGCVAAALLVLNYWYLDKYLSANSGYITAYRPGEDDLAQYRNPAVAGLFYSAQPAELSGHVDQYLQSGRFSRYSGYQPKIMIVPHAGYIYSAGTAGKAYAVLQKYAPQIKNVILLGPSHYYGGDGAWLSDIDYFATPLGDVAVNKAMVRKIASAAPEIKINNQAHLKEHSLEVQLPFVQKVLPKAKIVPLIYGRISPETLAETLAEYLKRQDTVLIVSADLSHYHQYEEAQKIDAGTAAKIEKGEPLADHESCGAAGINTALLLAARGNYRPQMLELINSGDVSGDKSRVVGYGAWSFYPDSEPLPPQSELERQTESLRAFAGLYGDNLRQIVRMALDKGVKHHKSYSPSRRHFPEQIFDKGASFVTLLKNGELRGCIGSILPSSSIAQDVASNAYGAALEDSRFPPVTADELPEIKFSIALLTGFEKIEYKDEADVLKKIKAGTDGIVIRDGNRQGVFLPSVWAELPDKEEFFKQLKIKAGMNPNYWNNRINVYRFRTVEIKDED